MTADIGQLVTDTIKKAQDTLSLQAAASITIPAVARIETEISEITAEGYPGNRFHAGSNIVDKIENACIEHAKIAFHAQHANVQALSCSTANIAVISSLIQPGETILSLDLKHGGHLTHGAKVSLVGQVYKIVPYFFEDEVIDVHSIRELAIKHQPKLVICGASSYPRAIDYQAFRDIADEIGAYLLADISHTSGLIVSGLLPSPIDIAHVTTTSTYKQLYGPRGGLILLGKDHHITHRQKNKPLRDVIDKGIFPGLQGTPDFGQIAMKAVALIEVDKPEFLIRMRHVIRLAKCLANTFENEGLKLVTGGTDTHMVIIDLTNHEKSGLQVERELEKIGIISNRNLIPNDKRSAIETTGVRFGTNIVAYRNLTDEKMRKVGSLIANVVKSSNISNSWTNKAVDEIRDICRSFPLRTE